MKIYFLLIIIGCTASIAGAQEFNPLRFGERLIIGNSLTYIPAWNNNNSQLKYHEWTWNKNIAVNLNAGTYLGLSHQSIFTRGSIEREEGESQQYFLTGIFAQQDFLPRKRGRLFAELSFNIGNYCTCGGEAVDPYEVEFLQYIGAGAGGDFRIWRFISLDLSFVTYKILDDVPLKYAYTQYIVGLNFDLINQ
jgi:hypothetical protein